MAVFYPNPSFVRERWFDLNGEWEFGFDDSDLGLKERWHSKSLPLKIRVPYVYQCKESGVNDGSYHPIIWYRKVFRIPSTLTDEETILSFNGVDYKATVFVNGNAVFIHEGGYTPFHIPISDYLVEGENTIALRVEDYNDTAQPRGKQTWTGSNFGCWYTASTGIWKDVWLQFTGKDHIQSAMVIPDLDHSIAHLELNYSDSFNGKGSLEVELLFNGEHRSTIKVETEQYRQNVHLQVTPTDSVHEIHTWSPDHPNLYQLKIRLFSDDGTEKDCVETYFGMRKICVRNGQILLNNRPLYQRLILDQGYWDDTLLTPPSKEALLHDLEMVVKMGFNGVRKHQKIEDPWFYHFADKLGILVWAELPSPYCFCSDEMMNVQRDMMETVRHLFNHPSVITWVPFNESWGVRNTLFDRRQQDFVKGIYHLIKSYDPSRLVSANDGWEHPVHDFVSIHDYRIHDKASYDSRWADIERLINTAACTRQILADCDNYTSEPVIISEFGGIALKNQAVNDAWGYRAPASDADELHERLKTIMDVIFRDNRISGFCYTQLTDVQQEVNGLLDSARNPKCDVDLIASVFGGGCN